MTEDQIVTESDPGVGLRIQKLEADLVEYKQNNRELSNISINLQKENEFLHNELRKDPARKIPDSQEMQTGLISISQKKLLETEEFEKIINQKEQLVDLTDALLTENNNLQAQLNSLQSSHPRLPPIIENPIYEDKNYQSWGQTASVHSEKNQFFAQTTPKKPEEELETLLNSNKKISEDLGRSKIQKEELSAMADELLRENDGLKFAATALEENLTKIENKNAYLESKFVQIYNTQVQSAISNYDSIGTENKRLTSKACDKIALLNEEVLLLSKERHSTLKKLE